MAARSPGACSQDAYDKGQQERDTVRRDMRIGKERGKQDAERVKDEAQQRTGNGSSVAAGEGATPRGSV